MAAETWGTSSARANAGQLPGGGTETAGPAAQPVLGSQSSRAGLLADQRAPFPAGIGTPERGGRCPRGPGTASPEARAKCVARTEIQWPQSTHLQGPSRGHPGRPWNCGPSCGACAHHPGASSVPEPIPIESREESWPITERRTWGCDFVSPRRRRVVRLRRGVRV